MTRNPSHRTAQGTLLIASVLGASFVAACEMKQAPPAPLAVSVQQFQQLRWIEGDWHGSGGGVDAFFERYRWVDDSTLRKYGFADSTRAAISDSGDITLRGGFVRDGSPEHSYVLVALDSALARFAPERGVSNGFEWIRTAPTEWSARITWDSAGVPRERTYAMRAMAVPPVPK